MANKHMKKCSTPYDFRESQITLAVKYMRYHCIPIGMAKIQNTIGKALEQQELSFIAGGNAK